MRVRLDAGSRAPSLRIPDRNAGSGNTLYAGFLCHAIGAIGSPHWIPPLACALTVHSPDSAMTQYDNIQKGS